MSNTDTHLNKTMALKQAKGIDGTLRVFEAFAGVGTQHMALRNINMDFEVVAISEIDEYAILSYDAIHTADRPVEEATEEEMDQFLEKHNVPLFANGKKAGQRKQLKGKKKKDFYEACIRARNIGDIASVDPKDVPDHDLMTYSFPCQDISVAGKGEGLGKGSGTRSGLLWECEKIIKEKRPKYLLMENVKALINKNHLPDFELWQEWLASKGYTNYWQVLNAKDYGVPQNRERVFMVSILDEHDPYKFPDKQELKLRLKDILEDEVDEKFYLSEEKTKDLTWDLKKKATDIKVLGNTSRTNYGAADVLDTTGISTALMARDFNGPKQIVDPQVNRVGGIYDKENSTHQAGSIYDKEGVSPTLSTMQGGWQQPAIIDDAYKSRSPRVYDEVSPTLRAGRHELKVGHPEIITHNIDRTVRVRKYEVDVPSLQQTLRDHRKASGLTLKQISQSLEQPLTLVEHWFRKDREWFAIPDPDQWIVLKDLLRIETDTFDQSIMTFIEKDGNFDSSKRVYDEEGISPTLTSASASKPILNRQNNPQIVASRGRKDAEGKYTQQLEKRTDEHTNTITSVQKDNLLLEPKAEYGRMGKQAVDAVNDHNDDLKDGDTINPFNKNISSQDGICPTLTTRPEGFKTAILPFSQLRIRKLTPLECWRLMGISDEDYEKTKRASVSQSQLYKQAGNAIVVDVLEGLFNQLGTKEEK